MTDIASQLPQLNATTQPGGSLLSPLESLMGIGQDTSQVPGGLDPMSLHLPQYQATVARQLSPGSQLYPTLAQFPQVAPQYAALQDQRINNGTAPYTTQEAQAAITAAGTHQPVTAPPDSNIFQNLVSDVQTLGTSIPKIPLSLLHEATQLGEIPGDVNAGIAKAQSPVEALGNIAQVPGLRLIPGAYNLGNLGTGGSGLVSGIQSHPLFAALDVLPYVSEAAGATKTVETAADVASQQAQIASDSGLDAMKVNLQTPPVKSFLRNWTPGGPVVDPEGLRLGVDESGNPVYAPAMVPNAFGQAVDTIKEQLAQTGVGQTFDNTFGADTRRGVRMANLLSSDITGAAPETFTTPLAQTAARVRDIADASLAARTLTPTEVADVYSVLQGGDPKVMASMSPEQQTMITTMQSADELLSQGLLDSGDAIGVPFPGRTEIYDTNTGNSILNARQKVMFGLNDIMDHYKGEGSYAEDAATPDYTGNQFVQDSITRMQDATAAQDWHAVRDEVGYLRDTARFDPLSENYNQTRSSLNSLINLENRSVPARWTELVQRDVQARVLEMINNGEINPAESNTDALLEAASHRLYTQMGLSDPEINDLFRESAVKWKDFQAQGLDPVFVHSVNPTQMSDIENPTVMNFKPSLRQIQERTWDAQGSINDPMISLKHQAVEIIRQERSQVYLDYFARNDAVNGLDMEHRLVPALEELKAGNPLLDAKSILQQEISKQYTKFDPESYFNGATRPSGFSADQDWYLPNDIDNLLKQLNTPTVGPIGRLMSPIMKTYRMSIMPLHPSFWMHQTFGGAVLTALQAENPLTIWKYIGDAMKLAHDPTAEIELSSIPGESMALRDIRDLPPSVGHGQQNAEYMRATDLTSRPMVETLAQTMGGRTLRRLADSMAAGGDAMDSSRGFMQSVAQKGFNFASFAHSMWVTTGFLEGYGNALSEGLSREEAIRAGVEGGRRIFETWDTLTPNERGIIRSVMPFYGFTRNLLKYVLQYPSTHPTRLSIMSNLAHAEEVDSGSGLPSQISDLLFTGPTTTDGTVAAYNLAGVNPFKDVASYASLLGFMAGQQGDLSAVTKNVNPLLSLTLTELGVDPTKGQGELHPDLYYDPATGSLRVKTGNPIIDAANAIVPQTQVLADLTGQNAQFRAALRTNPDAAGRMLLSSLGVPVLERDVNLPQERMKSEVTRFQQQSADLGAALKSGDTSLAEQWPGLQPVIAAIEAMTPEERAKFALAPSPSASDAVKGALTSSGGPLFSGV